MVDGPWLGDNKTAGCGANLNKELNRAYQIRRPVSEIFSSSAWTHQEGGNRSCYSYTISGWLVARCADGGLSRMQIRCTSSQVGKRIATDANCSWQPGGLTPPTKTLGPVPPRSMPVIEMEIQEGVL